MDRGSAPGKAVVCEEPISFWDGVDPESGTIIVLGVAVAEELYGLGRPVVAFGEEGYAALRTGLRVALRAREDRASGRLGPWSGLTGVALISETGVAKMNASSTGRGRSSEGTPPTGLHPRVTSRTATRPFRDGRVLSIVGPALGPFRPPARRDARRGLGPGCVSFGGARSLTQGGNVARRRDLGL